LTGKHFAVTGLMGIGIQFDRRWAKNVILNPAGLGLYWLAFDGSVGKQEWHDMLVHLLKSKIHRAQVTGASLNYTGSLTIAEDLIEAAGFFPYEKILCSNMANGARFETYVIKGKRGTGVIELNGAAAHCGKIGDRLTIMSFTEVKAAKAKKWKPKVIVLGKKNEILARK
jgi:aspartate 1-decarboxylase